MADILFVHNNFPGQFGHVAYELTQRGHRCAAIAGPLAGRVTGVMIGKYSEPASPAQGLHPWARRVETDARRAEAALRIGGKLQEQGFNPRLIIGHPAWGETLALRELFPDAPQILHGELYIPTEGGDIGFDPEQGPWTLDDRARGRLVNLTLALPYLEADAIVCPTAYQAASFPAALQSKIRIIHEGIGTDDIRPDPAATFVLPDGRELGRATPLITFVARKLEPFRGYHILMRALPQVLAALPTAEVLIIGAEGRGYGFRSPPPEGWKQQYLDEVKDRLDLSRIHFTGKLPHAQMIRAVQASSAHVYYSYPFVLSWSLLEAMSAGALVVASDTAAVREVVVDGENGLLGDFFDVDGLARRLIAACERPADFQPLREAARRTVVGRYDRARLCLPAWLALVEEMLAR